ncbi:ligase-associated DNA damage response endonuclease PdeM [Altererythrobacter aurantiacus]|uniref:Ligase-associated DNA damage response endonuclease PdeM n=1 Tax=Parapontixanthobacter aurantiacus TaxID=1463599 RepID=A0A844ZG83_9SPHN|nr:ligase-associated DNA damage response endonuclease PdeM [Parapontixanthobacter aurantiacus]MXO85977.1 ligase-associated DNA damage response endonuclease PdeM [Parapontixanthobacter aurantiacus]
MVPLSFAGEEWFLLESRALYWPRQRALLLADLHLEKASFYASHGQPLPPYDSRETLERVADAIRLTDAKRVITLGDNFHDRRGALRLEDHAAGMLGALTRMVDWTWITGNHDDGTDTVSMEASCGGTVLPEMELGGVVLRHIAKRGERRPEISGHFHPRLELSINRRKIRRPCVVVSKCEGEENSACRLVAPAFGALTAGMPAGDPAIVRALQPASDIRALLIAKGRLLQFPLWRENNSRAA